MSLIICVKNYECTQVVFNPIKSISVMELVKYETILSLCIESLKPSFNLGDKEELMKERICLEKAKKNEFSNQKKVQKRSRSIQMIATQSYSNVRSQRNQMMTEKMSRKPKKGSKKEEERRRKTKTGSVTADKKITSCCMMGICQSSHR